MKENEEQPGRVSTCFDGSPCAEMMEKIMGEKGIGSLSEEMMRKIMNDPGLRAQCEEAMRSLMKARRPKGPQESKEEE